MFTDYGATKEVVVPISQIRENDYNLSPSAYFPVEKKEEGIDIVVLNKQMRDYVVRKLDNDLSLQLFIIDTFEPNDLHEYIDWFNSIDSVVQKYKEEVKIRVGK